MVVLTLGRGRLVLRDHVARWTSDRSDSSGVHGWSVHIYIYINSYIYISITCQFFESGVSHDEPESR